MYGILLMEVQNDFMAEGFPFYSYFGDMAKAIIPPIKKLTEAARKRKIPVIYCNMVPIKDDALFKKFSPHLLPGTPGAEVVDELEPKDEDYIIPVYSMDAFLHSHLERMLGSLGVDTMVITGGSTDIGCLLTAIWSAYSSAL